MIRLQIHFPDGSDLFYWPGENGFLNLMDTSTFNYLVVDESTMPIPSLSFENENGDSIAPHVRTFSIQKTAIKLAKPLN